ncbi:hypothetical protein CDV36_002307 [Fusarium kuroshium]|uniref:CFEM domain-containing protein n=3 Tax=Fusarium solani species complex TaxID=232080 RepID=A0A3M2SKF1_9HYPO|nr:hypothetical protein CDV36_002307 [Fusarium kuroshium]RSL88889.1 hypothetical protein CEP51_001491 [Fusarium floridanum]RSM03297.1 hypothetical protein CEP52_007448 [Fusarium oligoseptatum]
MKAAFVVLAIAGLASAAEKTMFDALPECSHDCLTKAIKGSSDCQPEDSDCLCEVDNYRSIYSGAEACVLQACGAAKSVEDVLPAAAQFCYEVTGGATAPPVDESASVKATGSATTKASESTGTPEAAATSSTASPDGAAAMGSIGGFGMMVLGLLAAF